MAVALSHPILALNPALLVLLALVLNPRAVCGTQSLTKKLGDSPADSLLNQEATHDAWSVCADEWIRFAAWFAAWE
jgi:hypothetical protein